VINKKDQIEESLVGIVLLTLPISMKLNSMAIIIAVAYFLYRSIKEKTIKNLKFYWLSIAFFLAQFLSFLLSSDIKRAGSKLVLYLAFLLFPIMFSNLQAKRKFNHYNLIRWLFFGTAIVLFYGIVRFSYDAFILGERYDYGRGVALYLKYVPHHVYLSMFIIISIFGVLNTIVENKKKRFLLIFIPFFYLALILLSSRMAILIAVLILPIMTYFVLRKRMNRKLTNKIIFGFFTILTVIGFTNDFARDKILHSYYELANIATKENPFAGISFRKNVWISALELIKESPWIGYGIGDMQTILDNLYLEKGLDKHLRLNAHNQYLQLMLHHGLLIASFLLISIVNFIRKLIQSKMYFLIFSWFILLMFSLTESILNRQWGVILFAFVLNYTVYVLSFRDEIKKSKG